MANTSNVGTHNIYEDGDQKNYTKEEIEQAKRENRYHEGKPGSHKPNDAKDERSIANKLGRESKRDHHESEQDPEEIAASKKDATLPATLHGNAPSKGARIDQELREEEEEMLKKKQGKN